MRIFFFLSRKLFKMEQIKQEKFGTVRGKKWKGQRKKLAKDYLWKDKEQKQYIIRPAMKKLEDAQRERERREGDLLGLDLNSNLLLGFRRSRLLWGTWNRDRCWGTHHCSDKRLSKTFTKKDDFCKLMQLYYFQKLFRRVSSD